MFEALQSIPTSTVFIFGLAALISLLTSLANRLLSDPAKAKATRKEVAEWQTELRKAQKAGDKKTTDKLMKKQKQIMQMQTKTMWQSMKVTLIFFVPLLIIWQVLGGFYIADGKPTPVAYFPGVGPILSIPLFGNMPSLFWWYLFCSFFFGTIFTHIFGIVDIE
jgi:uncharacterized membrane protein (DUF106 family)